MRAVVCTRYGPPEVLQIRDVEKPVPGKKEALIRIRAAAVTSSDWILRSGAPSAPVAMRILMRLVIGVSRPRKGIVGLVLAGDIEDAGEAVTRFRAGDRVVAFTDLHLGAYAEYACLPETATMAAAPSNLTYEEAAAIPYGGLLALHYLNRGKIGSGQRVLVYGASGAVGTSAVQLARHFGAQVTAVCGTANLELARSLGADVAIDYTKEDAPPAGALYDLVLDAVGKRKTSKLKDACRKAVASGGKYVSVDDGTPIFRASELAQLTSLAEAGRLRPVIDRRYALEEIVEAHRYVEGEHKKGNVIVTLSAE
jgi:NADPH:quinone reductase-like Zn-dependent oxidoreductase